MLFGVVIPKGTDWIGHVPSCRVCNTGALCGCLLCPPVTAVLHIQQPTNNNLIPNYSKTKELKVC